LLLVRQKPRSPARILMKRWIVVAVLTLLASAALYWSERHRVPNHVGPEAVLNAAAETQKEVSHPITQVVRFSDDEEIEIGNSMPENYGHRLKKNAEGPIEKYVKAVGRPVAAHAHPQFDYKFPYIPDANFINAFALPGGKIFIGKGLMALMDSED